MYIYNYLYIYIYTHVSKSKGSYSMTSNGIVTLPKILELSGTPLFSPFFFWEKLDLPAVFSTRQVESLPDEDAKYHLQRCEDSGLWVPSSEVGGRRWDGKGEFLELVGN